MSETKGRDKFHEFLQTEITQPLSSDQLFELWSALPEEDRGFWVRLGNNGFPTTRQGYILFSTWKRPHIIARSAPNRNNRDILRECGSYWKLLQDAQKNWWNKEAAEGYVPKDERDLSM